MAIKIFFFFFFFKFLLNHTKLDIKFIIFLLCSTEKIPNENVIIYKKGKRYEWSQTQQQWILSSFYIGYVISHIPGGLIAEKFGGKWTCSLGVLFMAICSALTPVVIEYGELQKILKFQWLEFISCNHSGGWLPLIGLRILVGLGGGTTYPALGVLLASWVPEKERGKIGSVVFGGGQVRTNRYTFHFL